MRGQKGFWAVVVSAVLFGMMPIAAKVIYANGSNPMTLTFHRFLFSLPVLYGVARLRGEAVPLPSWQQGKGLLALSVGYVATPPLLCLSYGYISSGLSTTLHFSYPVLVLLAGVVLFRERLTRGMVLCCVLCVAGILAFYTPDGGGNLVGMGIALLSGVTYAGYIVVLARGATGQESPLVLAFYLAGIGAVAMLMIGLLTHTLTIELTPLGWLLSILFGMGTSGAATVLFQMGVKEIGDQKTALLSTFEPLTSVVAGVVLLGEPLTIRSAVGIGCILCAVLLLARQEKY